jgi:hypothetical protein
MTQLVSEDNHPVTQIWCNMWVSTIIQWHKYDATCEWAQSSSDANMMLQAS